VGGGSTTPVIFPEGHNPTLQGNQGKKNENKIEKLNTLRRGEKELWRNYSHLCKGEGRGKMEVEKEAATETEGKKEILLEQKGGAAQKSGRGEKEHFFLRSESQFRKKGKGEYSSRMGILPLENEKKRGKD